MIHRIHLHFAWIGLSLGLLSLSACKPSAMPPSPSSSPIAQSDATPVSTSSLGSIEDYVISLDRSECYGTCPSYVVEVNGKGEVTFTGRKFVSFIGTRKYTVPVGDVRGLIDDLYRLRIHTAERDYRARVTDHPTYTITIKGKDFQKEIIDYVGLEIGMPPQVSLFEGRIDEVTRTKQFLRETTFPLEPSGTAIGMRPDLDVIVTPK